MIVNLKQCPVCGSDVVLRVPPHFDPDYWYVYCPKLGCREGINKGSKRHFKTAQEAIDDWNQRVDTDKKPRQMLLREMEAGNGDD